MNSDGLIPSGKPPLHVALLPDGARRWAVSRGCSAKESYSASVTKLDEIVQALFGTSCNELTLLLSNWRNHQRTSSDQEAFDVGITEFVNLSYLKADAWGCSLHFVCPEDLFDRYGIDSSRNMSKGAYRLNICIAYDPIAEILEAVDRLGGPEVAGRIGDLIDSLWISRPVDLAIRTGGAPLFSGFLPLQLAYARLHLLDLLFNDVPVAEYKAAVRRFCALPLVYGT